MLTHVWCALVYRLRLTLTLCSAPSVVNLSHVSVVCNKVYGNTTYNLKCKIKELMLENQ